MQLQLQALAKKHFLAHVRTTGNVSLAAAAADVGRRTHYDWLKSDPAYAQEFMEALDEAADLLLAEARRRAVEGVGRLKFDKHGTPLIDPRLPMKITDNGEGEKPTIEGSPYIEYEYSDSLLMFLLRGARPDVFAPLQHHKITGSGAKGAVLLEAIVGADGEAEK